MSGAMVQDEQPEVGKLLRELRGAQSQKQIAEAAGVDPTLWSKMEKGERNVTERVIRSLDAAGLLTRPARRRLDVARQSYAEHSLTPMQRLEAGLVRLGLEVAELRAEVDELRRLLP